MNDFFDKPPLHPPFSPYPTSQPNQFTLPTYNIYGGGQIHETFKVDRFGNTFDEHTTIQLPGPIKPIRSPWE